MRDVKEILSTSKSRAMPEIRTQSFLQKVRRDTPWLMMVLPAFTFYLLFHYIPMYGVIISFQNFRIPRGVLGSEWVGFKWFLQFFQSNFFWRLIRNTLLISIYGLVFAFPVPIFFALFLDQIKFMAFKRFAQTASYLPYFISTVVVIGIMVNFLSPNNGLVNVLLNRRVS